MKHKNTELVVIELKYAEKASWRASKSNEKILDAPIAIVVLQPCLDQQ